MGLIKWSISLAMILIFSIAVISYVSNFGYDNDPYVDLREDTELSGIGSTLESDTVSFVGDSNGSAQSLASSELGEGDEVTRTGGSIKGTDKTTFGSVKTIMGVGYSRIFGDGNDFGYIFNVFIALLTIISTLVVVKAWLGRNPD